MTTAPSSDSTDASSERHRAPRSRVWIVLVFLGIAGLLIAGILPRIRAKHALRQAEENLGAARVVRVANVVSGQKKVEFTLPATSTPYYMTSLHAKSVGFLKRHFVEVGDHVTAGQILAEIAAPETDDEVRLAQARLEEAEANVGLSKRSAERNTQLAGSGVVSQERADDTQAHANSAMAALKTRRAELTRVSVLRNYQRIVAPFDGVVTKRNADPGALVGGSTGPLFEIAKVDRLRVLVDVPQVYASDIVIGSEATILLPQNPKATRTGKIVRTSGVLDGTTRTMRTEVELEGEGPILPGAFVYAKFAVERKSPPLVIPAAALMFRKEGPTVAVVSGGKIKLATLLLGRDFGKELEVTTGLDLGMTVVLNPTDDLADNVPVRIFEEKAR